MVVQIPVVLYSGGFYPRGFRTLESNDTVPGTDTTAQASGNAALVLANTALASGNAGISTGLTALASGNAGISTGLTALASGNVALNRAIYTSEWTLGANGNSDYTFTGPGFSGGENDPLIYLVRGQQYKFTNTMNLHPFRVQTTPNGSVGPQYNAGVTNNDVSNGTLIWNVQFDAPNTLYYQCTSHSSMGGPFYIVDNTVTSALASGNAGLVSASNKVPISGGTMTGVLAVTSGTAALPGITFTGDPNTGFWSPTADTIAASTGGTEHIRVDSSGDLKFNSGYGSVATAYGCRAWVNFNGTGTVAIRASANVSSITDNGAGDYTVNFTTAMVDANYVTTGSCQRESGQPEGILTIYSVNLTGLLISPTTAAARVNTSVRSGGAIDSAFVTVVIFR